MTHNACFGIESPELFNTIAVGDGDGGVNIGNLSNNDPSVEHQRVGRAAPRLLSKRDPVRCVHPFPSRRLYIIKSPYPSLR